MNLTEWRNNALRALDETYDSIKSNETKYHPTVRDPDKIRGVKQAVQDTISRLEVAVQSFELSREAANEARNNLEHIKSCGGCKKLPVGFCQSESVL
ncbi:hypothetical protein ERJ75_000170000 [Trypanosoma vivax]|nr:hypothetical protein ERJ75_000170000 [Trypanosoma vivax]